MDQIKRLINLFIPVSVCNLQCPYCHISHMEGRQKNALPRFRYSPAHIAEALSRERLGGLCYINVCGDGETLIPKEIPSIVHHLLTEGHYIELVTNGTLSQRIEELLGVDDRLLARLQFKLSFHYLELLRTGTLEVFLQNLDRIRQSPCSFTVEITPHDQLLPYLDQIRALCRERFGALCHITIARNDADPAIGYLTDLPPEVYRRAWEGFDSDLFRFKQGIFGVPRREYCYAGAWSLYVRADNGETTQCYCSRYRQNVFADLGKPIQFVAIGAHCSLPHCYNGHLFLSWGLIPQLLTPPYADLRNRTAADGSQWLKPAVDAFYHTRLFDTNPPLTPAERLRNEGLMRRQAPAALLRQGLRKLRGR